MEKGDVEKKSSNVSAIVVNIIPKYEVSNGNSLQQLKMIFDQPKKVDITLHNCHIKLTQQNVMDRAILSRERGSYKELQQRITQPMERERNASGSDENKINMSAALLSVGLYVCAILWVIKGSIYFNECPAQKMIPIAHIIIGCLALVSQLLSSPEECRNIFKKESNSHFVPQDNCRLCLSLLFSLAIICFSFALCYWTFQIHPDPEEGSPNYCEKEFYWSTYYTCIVALAILGIGFVLTCCRVCCVPVHAKSQAKGLEIEILLSLPKQPE